MNWYDALEPEIREIVKLLRDNGFNTTCSCGHAMWVEMDGDEREIESLYNLLVENKIDAFDIECHWENHKSIGMLNRKYTILRLPKKEKT